MSSIAMDIHKRDLPPAKSMPKPADWDYKNKEMQILKKDLQIICDEEREASREKTARQQLVIRVLGASTKIVDKWDEIAYLRDVTIACKDVEIEEIEKLLAEIKEREAQLEKDKKENLAEIAKLEGELASLKANNESKQASYKQLKKEFSDVKTSNKRLTKACTAAAEGNQILKATLEKIHGTLDESIAENKLSEIAAE
ncbi:unnamed protein product [Oikopleura dioica]|uniref:Uncharacterized protein n=1 Tax=Oikopleura dioica TaxID=34765 RepID=E4X051_OIKDI|nr:unnamed protein product [Oikopleura dioica]